MSVLLSRLLADDAALPRGAKDAAISGLTADSRQVKPGYLFAALPGTKVDGAKFIPQAIAAGAAAVIAGASALVPKASPDSDQVGKSASAFRARRGALCRRSARHRRRRHRYQRQDLGRGFRAPDLAVDGLSCGQHRYRRHRRTVGRRISRAYDARSGEAAPHVGRAWRSIT